MAGVIYSKKSFHEADDRNRAKRLMREAYRLLVKEEEMPAKTEWIFIARGAIEGKRVDDVMREMRWCVKSIGSKRDARFER